MRWRPWEDHADKAPVNLDILEPPCKECYHWGPRIKTDKYGSYAGVVLCTNESMHSDFSCYKEAVRHPSVKPERIG